MQAMLTEGRLSGHPFMDGASPAFLNHLEEFALESSFEPGQLIFSQGAYCDRFYLILEGEVAIESCVDGHHVIVQTLGPGEVVGWSWLFPPFQAHFTARALRHCSTVMINGASLVIRAEEQPDFGYELMKRVSRQIIHRLEAMRHQLAREIHWSE